MCIGTIVALCLVLKSSSVRVLDPSPCGCSSRHPQLGSFRATLLSNFYNLMVQCVAYSVIKCHITLLYWTYPSTFLGAHWVWLAGVQGSGQCDQFTAHCWACNTERLVESKCLNDVINLVCIYVPWHNWHAVNSNHSQLFYYQKLPNLPFETYLQSPNIELALEGNIIVDH